MHSMMRSAALLPLLLAACATAEPVPATPAATRPVASDAAVSSEVWISLRRGACFGRCPQYTVWIGGEGQVRYRGDRNVAAVGDAEGQADPVALAALIDRLRSPELAALKDVYRPGQAGCGSMATDMPSSRIEWQLDGRAHRLEYYAGCSGAPPVLRSLPAQIDAVAGSPHWVREGFDR